MLSSSSIAALASIGVIAGSGVNIYSFILSSSSKAYAYVDITNEPLSLLGSLELWSWLQTPWSPDGLYTISLCFDSEIKGSASDYCNKPTNCMG